MICLQSRPWQHVLQKPQHGPSSVQQDFPWLQPSRPYPATRCVIKSVPFYIRNMSKYVEILHQMIFRDFASFCNVFKVLNCAFVMYILQYFTTFCCCHWSILLPHAPRWPPVHAPPHRRWQQQAKNLLVASGHLLVFSEFRVYESKLTYWYGYRDAHKSQHPNIAILGYLFPSETNKIWDVAQSVDKAPATRLERLEPSNTVSSLKLAEDETMERAKHKDLCVKKKQSHHVPYDFMAMGKKSWRNDRT